MTNTEQHQHDVARRRVARLLCDWCGMVAAPNGPYRGCTCRQYRDAQTAARKLAAQRERRQHDALTMLSPRRGNRAA